MISYAMVWMPTTGLTLAETMDGINGKDIRANKIHMKNFFREKGSVPERCTLQFADCSIHLVTEGHSPLAWAAVTQPACPPVLVFGFLEEVRQEFLSLYPPSQVVSARRADPFIHFSSFLAKAKQRYNNPRSPSLRISLPELSSILRHRPPVIYDMTGKAAHSHQHSSNSSELSILNLIASMSVVFSIFVALLSIYRGIADYSQHNAQELDGANPFHGILFLLEGVLNLGQANMVMLDAARRKRKMAAGLLLALVLVTLGLHETRDPWQSGMHLTVAILSAISALVFRTSTRPLHRPKLEV